HFLYRPPTDYLFFFYPYAAPRDLPSFPTRRSSDLVSSSARSSPSRRSASSARRRAPSISDRRARSARRMAAAASPCAARAPRSRSEEHTSELQSRFDLVCRLLLEKKKKPEQNTPIV